MAAGFACPTGRKRMAESGTAFFANPDDYRAGIDGAAVNLVIIGRGDFRARLTWLKFRRLHICRSSESVPRIAFMALSPARTFVSFPVNAGAPLIWGGSELRWGEIVFHSPGERSHQRTRGAGEWGLVSLPLGQLAAYGKVLAGLEIMSSTMGRVLRPSQTAAAQLQRLYAEACDLAETKPEIIARRDAARALEEELVEALVNCLRVDGCRPAKRHHADIMTRFEDALSAHAGRQPSTPELCVEIGVPERTLRLCCAEFLGMSPSRYLRLRRLNMVRTELRRADPTTARVAEIARRYQFSELGRFAATYRAVFGEMPSDTLRRIAVKTT